MFVVIMMSRICNIYSRVCHIFVAILQWVIGELIKVAGLLQWAQTGCIPSTGLKVLTLKNVVKLIRLT